MSARTNATEAGSPEREDTPTVTSGRGVGGQDQNRTVDYQGDVDTVQRHQTTAPKVGGWPGADGDIAVIVRRPLPGRPLFGRRLSAMGCYRVSVWVSTGLPVMWGPPPYPPEAKGGQS